MKVTELASQIFTEMNDLGKVIDLSEAQILAAKVNFNIDLDLISEIKLRYLEERMVVEDVTPLRK